MLISTSFADCKYPEKPHRASFVHGCFSLVLVQSIQEGIPLDENIHGHILRHCEFLYDDQFKPEQIPFILEQDNSNTSI
jgi:hypothetical protein